MHACIERFDRDKKQNKNGNSNLTNNDNATGNSVRKILSKKKLSHNKHN